MLLVAGLVDVRECTIKIFFFFCVKKMLGTMINWHRHFEGWSLNCYNNAVKKAYAWISLKINFKSWILTQNYQMFMKYVVLFTYCLILGNLNFLCLEINHSEYHKLWAMVVSQSDLLYDKNCWQALNKLQNKLKRMSPIYFTFLKPSDAMLKM